VDLNKNIMFRLFSKIALVVFYVLVVVFVFKIYSKVHEPRYTAVFTSVKEVEKTVE